VKKVLILFISIIVAMSSNAQKTITFSSLDGLTITADFYENKTTDPYLLLFHQARFSRGEYKETAERFVKLGYNCLAVDLRSGDEVNYVKNETAARAREKGLSTSYMDAKQDMIAAIEFAYKQSGRRVVILGSSYSASLSLIISRENPNVSAAIAFSPGEYFERPNMIRDTIAGLDKPVFATSSDSEFPYLKELFSKVSPVNLTLFKPSKGKGVHGSSTLWAKNDGSKDCWLSLLLFFNQIKTD
jgi:hypothetical protein